MKIFNQIFLIFAICLLGVFISASLPIVIPGSVISMVILLVLLILKIIRPEQIKETAEFLLANLAFFFIPVTSGVAEYFEMLKDSMFAIVFICIFTTVLTFGVTAFTVTMTIKIIDARRVKKNA